ncbi:MAG: hypothetical protein AABZ44_10530, partial [Elusimicrobiota bacterium]
PNKPYQFYAANNATATTYAACAARRTSGAQGTTSAPYNGWGYQISAAGAPCTIGAAPAPSGTGACGVASCP